MDGFQMGGEVGESTQQIVPKGGVEPSASTPIPGPGLLTEFGKAEVKVLGSSFCRGYPEDSGWMGRDCGYFRSFAGQTATFLQQVPGH